MLSNPLETSLLTIFLYMDKLGNIFINDSFEREPIFFYAFIIMFFLELCDSLIWCMT